MIADKCVVTIARPPRATSASRYATAMALPSSGSVAPPISSINASVSGPASSRISASRSIEDENVERSERIACASPISVRTVRKTGRRVPAPAGIGIPHWASIAKRPAVFRTTVLPPAFGPETTSSRRSAGRSRSSGTASPPSRAEPRTRRRSFSNRASRRGWRAARSVQLPSSESSGIRPSPISPKRTRASMASSSASAPTAASSAGPSARIPRPNSASNRSASHRSSEASSARSLFASTTSSGSTNTVCPEPDRSCTMPGTRERAEARTGRQ